MTSQQQQAIREKEVQEAFWRFFRVNKNVIADCEANEGLLLNALEANLLPVSYDNLEKVWASLSGTQKATFAAPVGGIRFKPQVKSAETILEKHDTGTPAVRLRTGNRLPDGSPEIAKMNGGVLPERWTKAMLVASDRKTYRQLLSQYGITAVDDRLAGRS